VSFGENLTRRFASWLSNDPQTCKQLRRLEDELDAEKRPSAVTVNFSVWLSIDAARGGWMRMQTAALSEETSGHPWLINKKPPKDNLGGKRDAVLGGMPSQSIWQTVQRSPNR